MEWSHKLDDALWAFRNTFKTPFGATPFIIIYGKACHIPIKLEYKAYWALKACNMDLTKARANRFLHINEQDKLRLDAYESSISYKERTKKWHDKRKLKSRWYEPFTVYRDMRSGEIELCDEEGNEFTVNKQRVKPYQKDISGFEVDDDLFLNDEGGVTNWEALGRNTRDLDLIWEETRQDYNFTRSGFKDARTILGDNVAIPRDAVRT
uniref:Reverse transcriptase domain-containing protein n=1 Tax=Tanacetum cinerariifolium TaxID=118510 RepID=A0A6L2MQH6_TANCI|nr:hypothetical protein [Tanacetum cinerariifolium]